MVPFLALLPLLTWYFTTLTQDRKQSPPAAAYELNHRPDLAVAKPRGGALMRTPFFDPPMSVERTQNPDCTACP